MRKLHPLFLVLLALMAVGIVYQLIMHTEQLIIPVAVFAIVFLLYKFPPGRMRAGRARRASAQQERSAKSRSSQRKSVPFRVIEGGKDDDNLPKYH